MFRCARCEGSRVGVLAVLSFVVLMVAVPGVAGQEFTSVSTGLADFQVLGDVSDQVEVDVSEDVGAYYKGKVARTPVEPGVSGQWQDVELVSAFTYRPLDLWSGLEGGERIVVSGGPASLDTSQIDPGMYTLFLWGCDVGGAQPSNCRWLRPHVFNVEFVVPDGLVLSAHMGAGSDEVDNSLAPENTLMAFDVTMNDIGLNSVEFDVRRAADGYVVIHDKNTKRTTGEDYVVGDTPVSTLTQLRADADYDEVADSDYSVSPEEAAAATIPSLEETLNFFQGTDMILRIEFKGGIRGDRGLAREVYQTVADRGMTDQAIFMAFEGSCKRHYVEWRRCTYPALEAIEDASGGNARTAILWQKRKDPRNWGRLNHRKLSWEWALGQADENNFDIFVARDDNKRFGIQNGLGDDRDAFVQEARNRGIDYAFMSFAGTREEQLAYGVEWLSTNRPDQLMREIREMGIEEYSGEYQVG